MYNMLPELVSLTWSLKISVYQKQHLEYSRQTLEICEKISKQLFISNLLMHCVSVVSLDLFYDFGTISLHICQPKFVCLKKNNFILQCLKYNLQFIKCLSHWHWSRHFFGLAVGRNLPYTIPHADTGHWTWVVWMRGQSVYYSHGKTAN